MGVLAAQHAAKVSFLPEVNFHLHQQQARCPFLGKTWAGGGKGGHCAAYWLLGKLGLPGKVN